MITPTKNRTLFTVLLFLFFFIVMGIARESLAVQLLPPARITVPRIDTDGSYTVNWTESPTVTTGITYRLQEATNSTFTIGVRIVPHKRLLRAKISGRETGKTYYYRVLAIKTGWAHSDWKNSLIGCAVKIPAEPPTSITIPDTDADGSYVVSWGASVTPGVTYVLQQATNASFTTGVRTIPHRSLLSAHIYSKALGTYFYRVKATKAGYTNSAWRNGEYGCVVQNLSIDWQWMSPLPQGENLYSIWKNNPSDIYAVGDFGTVLHFDGTQWTELEHKIFTGRLTTVWSDSETTFFGGVNGTVIQLTENGPINIGPGGWLTFSRLWKLGDTIYALHSSGLKKLDATNVWTDVQIPIVTQYTDLWGDGDILFVTGKGGFFQQYDSATNTWTDLSFPASGIDIYSLWGNADTIIISGSQGNVWEYDRANKTWLNISPNSGDLFLSVWFDAFNNIFIASQSNLGRFDGSTWTFFNSNTGFFQDLHGGLAVGWHGRIFSYNNGWAQMQPKYNTDTYKAKVIGDNIYAAGWEGRFYKYDKEFQILKETQTKCAGIYRDIWGDSEDNIVMVGTRGNICHFFDNGTGFPEWHYQAVFPPVSTKFGPALNGVWGDNQQNIYAVGDNKSIFHFNGIEWVQQLEELNGPTLEGIWGTSPSNIYAVGTGGLILHYDGANWNEELSPTTNNLTSVWGFSPDNIYIVGAGGTILNFDGQQWKRVNTNLAISPYFLSVWGINNNVFVGGSNGAVLLFNGSNWRQLETGTSFPFYSICGINGRVIIGTSGNGNEGAAWRYIGAPIPIP